MAADQAFGFEEGVSGGDRGTVQAKCASQFPSGWQPFTFLQTTDADKFLNGFSQLPIERRARRGI